MVYLQTIYGKKYLKQGIAYPEYSFGAKSFSDYDRFQ